MCYYRFYSKLLFLTEQAADTLSVSHPWTFYNQKKENRNNRKKTEKVWRKGKQIGRPEGRDDNRKKEMRETRRLKK